MNPLVWKGLAVAAVMWAIFQLLSSFQFQSRLFDRHHTPGQHSVASSQDFNLHLWQWQYSWERDRNNMALSSHQCEASFPRLYEDIDRAAGFWNGRLTIDKTIFPEILTESNLRVLVCESKLRILHSNGIGRITDRAFATLFQLQSALVGAEAANEPLPDMEFNIALNDFPVLPRRSEQEVALWAFARDVDDEDHNGVWLIPDFHFWAGGMQQPPFSEMQRMARSHDSPLSLKKPQAVWRGVRWTAPEIRGALLSVAVGQPWADVQEIDWDQRLSFMYEEDYCDFRFLISTEGRSWSARLTAILNCDAVPIVHDIRWQAHYYHLLEPDVNHVHVRNDFEDLDGKVEKHLRYPGAAQKIADEARRTFRERYITPAATACYWRRLLRTWREVGFEPLTYRNDTNEGRSAQLRGISFEQFL